MRSIRSLSVVLLIFIQLIQTGCWNNRDLAQLSIATGIGIDRTGEGRILLTIQIAKPSSIVGQGKGGGAGEKKAVSNVAQEGDTVFEALRAILKETNNRIFLSAAQIIIVGEDIARNGISDVLDFFERDHETQYKTEIVIAKGITAKELLEVDSMTSDIPASYIAETVKNNDERAKTAKTMLIDISRIMGMTGKQLIVGTVGKNGKRTVDTEGSAVFNTDKLAGWLSQEETRGYLFAAGKVKSTVITIPNPASQQKKVSVEIIRSGSKLGVEWENGKPVFTIKIKTEGNFGDQQNGGGLTAKESLEECERLLKQQIMQEVESMMKISQKEYKSDILGFGEMIHRYHSGYWKGAEQNWREIYSRAPLKLDVEVKIRRSGLITRPAESK